MQCQQPLFGISSPCQGCSQFYPVPSVNPHNGLAPNVIGEGEVNAITYPDGSIQYYFLPVRWQSDIYWKRWPPYDSKPNTGVWVIRNFTNTISPMYNQYWQRTNIDPLTKPSFSYDCNGMPAGFQLKFHNDCWTSTTDLHCFVPRIAAIATAAQVEIPAQIQHCCQNTNCNDSGKNNECLLNIMKEYNNLINHFTKLEKDTCSCMSVDKAKSSSSKTSTNSSNTSLRKPKHRKNKVKNSSRKKEPKKVIIPCDCHTDNTSNKTEEANKNHKIRLNENNNRCEEYLQKDLDCSTYDRQSKKEASGHKSGQKSARVTFQCGCDRNADKGVTTYTDQASNVKEEEGQTQTDQRSSTDVSTIMTSTTTISPRKSWPASSEKLIDICDLFSDESLCSRCRNDGDTNSVD